MSITCYKCGFDANPEGTEFCEACGSDLTTVTTSSSISIDHPETINPAENIPMDSPILAPEPPEISTETPTIPSTNITGMAKLVAKQSDYPKSEFKLSTSECAIIGRYDDTTGPVDIDLMGFPDDDTISRNHAEIYFENNQWKIKPLSTTNSTFIKKVGESRFGSRITAPEIINNGDEIAFAKLRFLFYTSTEAK